VGAKLERTSTPGVFKRGNRYAVIFRDAHGKQRQRSARTLVEARKLRSALSTDVARGEYRELSRVDFADYAATWSRTYRGRTGKGPRRSVSASASRDQGCEQASTGSYSSTATSWRKSGLSPRKESTTGVRFAFGSASRRSG